MIRRYNKVISSSKRTINPKYSFPKIGNTPPCHHQQQSTSHNNRPPIHQDPLMDPQNHIHSLRHNILQPRPRRTRLLPPTSLRSTPKLPRAAHLRSRTLHRHHGPRARIHARLSPKLQRPQPRPRRALPAAPHGVPGTRGKRASGIGDRGASRRHRRKTDGRASLRRYRD